MNTAPKAVFSSTLTAPGWANATVLGGDLGAELDASGTAFGNGMVGLAYRRRR
jgi:hypothetical protein